MLEFANWKLRCLVRHVYGSAICKKENAITSFVWRLHMTVLVHSLILLLCVPCKPRMVDCTVVHQLHHSGQMTFEVCLRRHCHTQEIMFWGEKRRYCFASHIVGTNDCAIYYLKDCAIFRPFNIVVCTLRIDGTCTSEMGMSLCHPLFG